MIRGNTTPRGGGVGQQKDSTENLSVGHPFGPVTGDGPRPAEPFGHPDSPFPIRPATVAVPSQPSAMSSFDGGWNSRQRDSKVGDRL